MQDQKNVDITYFPGCTLATTAKENNQSLIELFRHFGYNLVELEDWNCCGSTSAHSINSELALDLAGRNLSLAPKGRPLLAACPSCLLRLRHVQKHLKTDERARDHYEETWGKPFDTDLEILHFFELMNRKEFIDEFRKHSDKLDGLKFVTYYGCMLARPPEMRNEKNYHGFVEKLLSYFGAESVNWPYTSRCCGTFLTVARPEVVTPMVNKIVQGAKNVKADCIVTACAMCHMNLEARSTIKEKLPIFHFSELLSLALGVGGGDHKKWFSRHLINPMPLLKAKAINLL